MGKPKAEANSGADALRTLTDRAQNGDATALPSLREFFQQREMVELTGNLARHAEKELVAKFCGKNLLVKEGLTRKLEAMRAELAGPDPHPLERLLAERVAACWLHLHYLETLHAGQERMPLDLGVYYQRCLTAAQKRYLAAIKTLALVRKLALPALRGNNGSRQPQALPPPGERAEGEVRSGSG